LAAKSMHVIREAAPIRKQTANNLRNAILEGRFKPGERLNEQKLCRLMGVSRTSIREAMRQLETEGLVTTIANKGPIVTEITLEQAKDIYEVRAQLESLAVRLFVERADDSQVATMAVNVTKLKQSALKEDLSEFLKATNEFYDVLSKGCNNKVVYSFLRSLIVRVSFLRTASLSTPGRMEKSAAEIKRILNAIEKRDSQAACEACVDHVQKAALVALPALRKWPKDALDKNLKR